MFSRDDILSHLCETFGLSDSLYYEHAVGLFIRHEKSKASCASANARRSWKRKNIPAFAEQERAREQRWRDNRSAEQRAKDRAAHTAYNRRRVASDPEFVERRRAYNREYMRARRAKKKAAA